MTGFVFVSFFAWLTVPDLLSSCTGDATQICGGPGALTVYQRNGAAPPSGAGTPKQSVKATDGSTYAYQGCFTDGASRNLNGPSTSDPSMTAEKCVSFCRKQNKQTYAGLEYSTECYCGSSLKTQAKSTNCNMACAGDSTETCGGGYALTTYKLSS